MGERKLKDEGVKISAGADNCNIKRGRSRLADT